MEKFELRWISSWDDGGKNDIRLAAILKKYNLPAIFFIPTCCELKDEQIKELSKDFEIGGHTVNHPQNLQKLSEPELAAEIIDNKEWLEELIGKKITKFCYPRGRYNSIVMAAVKGAGFDYARTTKVLKTVLEMEINNRPLEAPTTIHVFQRDEYKNKPWEELAKLMAEHAALTNGIFHIWGHSKEISRDNNWEKLEEFFKWLIENYNII